MICTGTGPDGEIRLPSPVRIRLERDADAPADSFEGTFPPCAGHGRITKLTIRDEAGNALLDGIIDEQEESLTDGAFTLSVRSRAALLLDNEALPQNYVNPSLATVFDRHIRPYGFTQYLGNAKSFSGTLTVTKGMSEWSAAAAFCSHFLKTTPRIVNGVFDASGTVPETELVFGTGGIRYSSGLLQNRYCKLYSELYALGSGGGTYLPAARDAEAETLGVRRRRFLSGSGTDVSAVLNKAEQSAFACVLVCPGFVRVPLLSPARLSEAPESRRSGLFVSSVHYVLDADGEYTKITLRRK